MPTRRLLYISVPTVAAHLKIIPTLEETKALENYYKKCSNVFAFGVKNIMIKKRHYFLYSVFLQTML